MRCRAPNRCASGRDQIEGGRFDLAAEHAATHQPGVDEQVVFCCKRPIMIAITPLSPNRSSSRSCSPKRRGIVHDRQHVLLGVAPGGQIELVGLVDELDNALQADLVEATPDELHLQARR